MNPSTELIEWVMESPHDAADELLEHRLKAMADADELTPEQEAEIKDNVASVRAGLEQVRAEM